MEYQAALDRARAAHPIRPDDDVAARSAQRFESVFGPLSEQSVHAHLDQCYSPDLWFNDTLKTITDRGELGRYLSHTARAVEHCNASIDTWSISREGDVVVRWTMQIRFKRFARGRNTESMGISLLRLDAEGRIAFQQDFWNAADGLFQHVPLLGWAIRAIKRRV